jgi:hypothetical protein
VIEHERELQPSERAALRAWAERDVAADFADEVLARWQAEREDGERDDGEREDGEREDGDDVCAPVLELGLRAPRERLVPTRAHDRRDAQLAWWCGLAAAAAAIALALALAVPHAHDRGAAAIAAASSGPELVDLRAAAHGTLLARCTPCHLAAAPAADPDALAVFDLGDPSWHIGLSAEQLAAAIDRVAARGGPDEAAGFRRYVDAELAHRGAAAR